MRMRYNRGKQKIRADDAGKRQGSCGENRVRVTELSKEAGNTWAKQKSHAKSDTDNAERFGAVFRFRDIGDVRLSDRQIACRQPVDDTGKKDKPKRVSEAQDQKANT